MVKKLFLKKFCVVYSGQGSDLRAWGMWWGTSYDLGLIAGRDHGSYSLELAENI